MTVCDANGNKFKTVDAILFVVGETSKFVTLTIKPKI